MEHYTIIELIITSLVAAISSLLATASPFLAFQHRAKLKRIEQSYDWVNVNDVFDILATYRSVCDADRNFLITDMTGNVHLLRGAKSKYLLGKDRPEIERGGK